jgi:hypothetical protein
MMGQIVTAIDKKQQQQQQQNTPSKPGAYGKMK